MRSRIFSSTLGLAPWVVMAGVLTGCATSSDNMGVQAKDLRNSTRFITERLYGDLNFPTLQRGLFQHRAACGSAPRFVMHEGETSRASLIDSEQIPTSYENVVLMDLVQYPANFRGGERVEVQVYSYYYNDAVQQRIDEMLNAIERPGVCDPKAEPSPAEE